MAKFSKQDYVSIARVIDDTWSKLLGEASVPRYPGQDCRQAVWQVKVDMEAVVTAFADMFAEDNDRFDRERFVTACEGGSPCVCNGCSHCDPCCCTEVAG